LERRSGELIQPEQTLKKRIMTPRQIQVIRECVNGSMQAERTFPQIIGDLDTIGVERYHADYSRQETTYYLSDGESLVVETPHASQETAMKFSASLVEASVRQSQRGEHSYLDFVCKTIAAGCVGYFVHIRGKNVIYFGRRGECHVEHFPSDPPVQSK
jgi:uncharacterized protein YbcV (DUF1398 family)